MLKYSISIQRRNMGFFNKIIKAIKQASVSTYSFENNNLKFLIDGDEFYIYELGQYDMKTRHDPYTMEAYTLKNSDVHVEFIRCDASIDWRGQPRSLYEGLMKEKLKVSMELKERIEIDKYEFSTYKIDDNFILHFIYIWENQKNTFIIDTQGKLYTELLCKLKPTYTYNFDNEEKGSVNFDLSLVKNNAFEYYFKQSN